MHLPFNLVVSSNELIPVQFPHMHSSLTIPRRMHTEIQKIVDTIMVYAPSN